MGWGVWCVVLLAVGARTNEPEFPGDQFVDVALADAISRVDEAIAATAIWMSQDASTAFQMFSQERCPSPEAQRLARSGDIFDLTIQIILEFVANSTSFTGSPNDAISEEALRAISDGAGCFAHRLTPDCTGPCVDRYRTTDGTCNNVAAPSQGASLTSMARLLTANYSGTFNLPRGFEGPLPSPLPSPREVVNLAITAAVTKEDRRYTHLLMAWGQFLDHDIDLVPFGLTAVGLTSGDLCEETCATDLPCFPIPPGPNDPRLTTCIPFTRSCAGCGSGDDIEREQINELTSYIDGSMIYGSNIEISNRLRDPNDRALLKTSPGPSGEPLLPLDEEGTFSQCAISPVDQAAGLKCFMAGDIRSNEVITLTTMHTLWMREHNRVANVLRFYNPSVTAETIYQEARKIVGAQIQHITFEAWLPKIIGPGGEARLGNFTGYKPSADASILNEFATATFRFGHTLIRPELELCDNQYNLVETLSLRDAFFNPALISRDGKLDPLVCSLIFEASKRVNPRDPMNPELTEHLFENGVSGVALDLASLNIQRGRDHGLPTYTQIAALFGVNTTASITGPRRSKLERLYDSFEDVDLWVGCVMENEEEMARLGPVTNAVMVEQMRALRDGDRFWYENDVFTPAQLTEIQKSSMARIICDNSDGIDLVPLDAFARAAPENMAACSDVPGIDLGQWLLDPEDQCEY